MNNSELINEIDAAHKVSNNALKQRDFDNYISVFADRLAYQQLNGEIIGKKQLVSDIKNYFNRITSYSSEYKRIDFSSENNKVIEKIIQQAKATIRVFIFFSKSWTVEREGIYEWEKINNAWKIVKVEIVKEKVF